MNNGSHSFFPFSTQEIEEIEEKSKKYPEKEKIYH